MLGPTSPLQGTDRSAAELSLDPRPALAAISWRALLIGALLSVLAGAALSLGLTGGWPSLRGERSARSAARASDLAERGLSSLPLTAQAPISAALGADASAYHVQVSSLALQASSPPQRLRTRFDSAGVQLSSGALELHLRLSAVGYAGALRSLGAVRPRASANRVSYQRAGLSEWYLNGPAGLEQGFTIPSAPAQQRSGSLTLALVTSGNATATLDAAAQSVSFSNRDAALHYGALRVTDAAGRLLHSSLALHGATVLLRVDDVGARYPLSIDPLIQQGGKLTGAGEQGEGRFGISAALSADGSTALIGGPRDNEGEGAAWVFVRSGSSWVQQGEKLTSGETAPAAGEEDCTEESSEEAGECAFGQSVALSADGNTALIGDPSATSRRGTAWVFTRSGATWSLQDTLTGSNEGGEGRFGKSVALSADGNTALIGDPSATNEQGMAWVFAHGESGWTPQAMLADPQASPYTHIGRSVALSGDGSIALLGGPGDAGYAGAAWVFQHSVAGWSERGKLTGAGEKGAGHFGKSVALSADGAIALVGGLTDDGGRGAVWPFARTGSSFLQQGEKLVGGEAGGEPHFGQSVALSGDGSRALIGAPHDEGGRGTVTQYARSGSSWSAIAERLGGSQSIGRGWSGSSVALSDDGLVGLVGAIRDNARAGAAWVFAETPQSAVPPPTVTNVVPGHGPATGGTEVEVRGTNFTAATAVRFGSAQAQFTFKNAALLTAISPAGAPGKVDVTVTTPIGTSAISSDDTFRFDGNATPNPAPGSSTTASAIATGGALRATGGTLGATSSASANCSVFLHNKHLAVRLYRVAALRLLRSGTGACRGKVTLAYKARLEGRQAKAKGKRFRLKTLGSARFSIAPGASQVVKVTLSKEGQALLRARHGRLSVSLAIVRVVPAPTVARTASVRLTWKKTPRSARVTR